VTANAGRLKTAWLADDLSGPTTSSLPRRPSGRGWPVTSCWSTLDSACRNRMVSAARSRSCHSSPHSSPVRAPVAGQDHEGAQPRPGVVLGGGEQQVDLLEGQQRRLLGWLERV
jgi:hypothetical protein